MNKKLSIYELFWLFIFGSVFGWVLEGAFSLFIKGELINHSAVVIGPFNFVYGFSACALTMLLYRFKDKGYLSLYFIGFVGGTILEYIMSWGMEIVLGFSAWDYSGLFLNINGRVCFIMSFLWGFLAILWIKFVYPHVANVISKMNKELGKKLMLFLIVFLLFDMTLTYSALLRARACENGVPPINKYEEFLDRTFNKKYLKNMFNNTWKN